MADPPPLWALLPSGQRASGDWVDDTLRERASEAGLLDKVPLAARFLRQRVEVVRGPDPEAEVNRRFYLRGWTDGLPVVPPTLGRVEEALSWAPAADAAPDAVLGELDPLKGLATVEKVAGPTRSWPAAGPNTSRSSSPRCARSRTLPSTCGGSRPLTRT